MTFDHIISKIPEVERRSVAGERLCLAVLSSLEDSIFPLTHRIVVNAVRSRWANLEACDEVVHESRGRPSGRYAKLPVEQKATNRPNVRNNETIVKCGARILQENLASIIAGDSVKYNLEGADALARAAVEELTTVTCPDHPVVVCKEDPEAADGSIAVYFSLTRLENADASIADVVKKLTKRGRTQLMMNAHEVDRDRLLPQFPAYVDDGANDAPPNDDDLFARRCESLFLDPDDPEIRAKYHNADSRVAATASATTTTTRRSRAYPRDLVRETMLDA